MSGAVCPACGIAVVPGYVRCPKCHKPLPRFARDSISPVGGTVVEAKRSNGIYLASGFAALFVLALVAHHFWVSGKSDAEAATSRPNVVAPVGTPPTPTPEPNPPVPPVVDPAAPQPTVHADEVAVALKRRLDKQRLWATVTVVGDHVDLRSTACGDAAVKHEIEQSAAQFHAAGLTRLRCLEQSGAVVFARTL
ncbi:hypothetical protein BH11MYX1_BH11MYX1_21630 [soil metagenome]